MRVYDRIRNYDKLIQVYMGCSDVSKFYGNALNKMQDAYPGVLDGHEGHTRKKLLSTTLHTPYLAEI